MCLCVWNATEITTKWYYCRFHHQHHRHAAIAQFNLCLIQCDEYRSFGVKIVQWPFISILAKPREKEIAIESERERNRIERESDKVIRLMRTAQTIRQFSNRFQVDLLRTEHTSVRTMVSTIESDRINGIIRQTRPDCFCSHRRICPCRSNRLAFFDCTAQGYFLVEYWKLTKMNWKGKVPRSKR